MLTGYNTDVKHNGKVYHVQTEDKGVNHPLLETLVYVSGGQIIASKQYNYAKLVKNGKCDEKELAELLESQHRQVMRWIKGGKFDEGGPPPFGSTIISERGFDEIVLEFIKAQSGTEPIEIVPKGDAKPSAGSDFAIHVLVRGALGAAPAGGAAVSALIRVKGSQPEKIFSDKAGADGVVSGMVGIPAKAKGGFLMLEARHGAQVATMEMRIG